MEVKWTTECGTETFASRYVMGIDRGLFRFFFFFFLMIRRPPRSTPLYSSAASDVYRDSGTAMFCDNLALVNKIVKRIRCTHWYPNETITSDWDIIQAIVSTLQTFPKCPEITHVMGHQDNHTTYDQLPLEAQLNVDADAAATKFQDSYGSRRWQVPRICGNRAQLYLSNKTVTHHYVKNLRHAYSHPLLRAYIGKRNQWSGEVLSTINWPSLGAACNKHHKQRHFVVKLNHDILLTR